MTSTPSADSRSTGSRSTGSPSAVNDRAPRIAVVGTGWWSANHHVPSLAGYAGADLVALCDPQRDRAEQLAAEHGGRAEILVHARDEDDLMLAEEIAVALDRLVEPAER